MIRHQYQLVHQDLKALILGGTYKEGDLIPSENELCEQYNITRPTIRQALSELAKEGIIERIKGKGSVVTSNTRASLNLLSIKGFSEAVSKSNHIVKSIFLKKPSLTIFPDNFFYPLSENEKKSSCLYIERIRLVDDQPVMIENTFMPIWLIPDMMDMPLIEDSLFKTLSCRYNIVIKGVEQDIRAISAEEGLAFLLKMPIGAPLIHIYRKYKTNKARFYIYSSLYCNTEHYSIGNYF
jgi:DNA-binding GntR family transcriptional regulator